MTRGLLRGALLAREATGEVDFGRLLVSQASAWDALKADYPQLYRHEIAHAEEGPRAGADGWVHARR